MKSPTLTVEVAFSTNPGSTPTWTYITNDVRSVSINRGRRHELDRMEAGTASLLLNNRSGNYTPTNTSGAYYPNVLPMRRIRIRGTYGGTTYDLFHGYVEGWPQSWEIGDPDATIQVMATDAFKVFSLASVDTTRSAELSGARVGAILDAVSWPAGDRSIDTGISTIQASTLVNVSALEHIQSVADTEGGVFFMSPSGIATFKSRGALANVSPGSNTTWGDQVGEHRYSDIVVEYDDSSIWNDVRIDSPGVTQQTASDSTSQTTFYKRTLTKSLLHNTTAQQLSQAQALVGRYKQPLSRITSFRPSPYHSNTDQWAKLLGSELWTGLTVRRRPASGSMISQGSVLEGISWDISQDGAWSPTWTVSVADLVAYWVLEDPVLGVLDSTTRLFW